MLLIKNGLVYTMKEEQPIHADILIDGDKIVKIAENIMQEGAEILDAAGLQITPGLIDAHCHIGMFEDGIGVEGADGNEATDPITPHMRAIDGINPYDRAFAEARRAGITTVITGPGSANVIGGLFAAMKTFAGPLSVTVLNDAFALKAAFGENPKRVYNQQDKEPSTRMATAALLRNAFFKAKEYAHKKHLAEMDADKEMPEFDMANEVLERVLRREMPLKIHAHRADDIQTAMRIAKEFEIDYTIDHCTEGHLMLDILKEEKVKVILGPILSSRPKIEMQNLNYSAPAQFAAAGIPFAICTDHPEIPINLLSASAALAVQYGLSEITALRAITLNAARICGLEERMGSIEAGKDADLAIFCGHPLDVRTRTFCTLINGQMVYHA